MIIFIGIKIHINSYAEGKTKNSHYFKTDRKVCLNCSLEILPGKRVYVNHDYLNETSLYVFDKPVWGKEFGKIVILEFHLEERILAVRK